MSPISFATALIRIRTKLAAAMAALLLIASSAGPARAATVTLGQVAPQGTTGSTTNITTFQYSSAPTSPSYVVPAGNWTVTSWSSEAGTTTSLARLRIIRPVGNHVTIVAETSDQSIPANTNGPFPTNLPVQEGDLIGFQTGNPAGNIAPYYPGQFGDTAEYILGAAQVGDSACGSMFACATATSSLTNVSVTLHAPDPPNTFSFGKVKRNKRNGTATLAVTVPGPGTLDLSGKGVKSQRAARVARAIGARAVPAAGTVKLRIKPKGKAKKKLSQTGKAKVKVRVTYTPTGGQAKTQSKRVKLAKTA
jgi:hypothetical protein